MNNLDLLDSLLTHKSISLQKEAQNWEEAIILALKPLVKAKTISPLYAKAIIDSTKKFGPYYLIDKQIAMPHARPSNLIYQDSFALLTLKEPVYFLDDPRPIKVLICLAATSAQIHVSKALPQIVAVFENKKAQEEIMLATTVKQIKTIIENIDFKKYL